MSASIFDDKLLKPEEEALKQALGEFYDFWQEIKQFITANWGAFIEEWRFYNQRSGWLLKILIKKRNLFFFVPTAGGFSLSFIFGDRAAAAIDAGDFPENIKDALRNAKKYMEGRGLSVDIKTAQEIGIAKKLIAVKMDT
jgi:hypothetical protein